MINELAELEKLKKLRNESGALKPTVDVDASTSEATHQRVTDETPPITPAKTATQPTAKAKITNRAAQTAKTTLAKQEKALIRKRAVLNALGFVKKYMHEWAEEIQYPKANVAAYLKAAYANLELPSDEAIAIRDATQKEIEGDLAKSFKFKEGNPGNLKPLPEIMNQRILQVKKKHT